jgi:hypothetical protein
MGDQSFEVLRLKREADFNFASRNLPDLLRRTTENTRDKLWRKLFNFDMSTFDFSPFKGEDVDMSTPLVNLKNKRLVYSVMLQYLGRSLFCSKSVQERFKTFLKRRLKDSLETNEHKPTIMNYCARSNHTLDDLIAPHNQQVPDVLSWQKDKLTWPDFVDELGAKELVLEKLREKCNLYDISDSADFMIDLLACIHLDNYIFKNIQNSTPSNNWLCMIDRTITWIFPCQTEVRCNQKKSLQGARVDKAIIKPRKEFVKLEYKEIEKDLDPYLHGGHFRSILGNNADELDYYVKRLPGKQLLTEVITVRCIIITSQGLDTFC